MGRERNWWGWGYTDAVTSDADVRAAAPFVAQTLGFDPGEPEDPVPLESIVLPAPRIGVPPALREICSVEPRDRITCSTGQAYRDVVRSLRGRVDHPTDVVAMPRSEAEVEAVLEWAAGANAAVIPYGGGTSVVGGVEPRSTGDFDGVITLDLGRMDRVLDVDTVSRAARIQAGAAGPVLESQLAEHGLTLRFFPQSYELSTLGGWIATRAAGHFATGPTHIDDLVESVRAVSYGGTWASARLPASGAGPSPDRLLLGSEGTLGVVTEAWMRVRPRPSHKATTSLRFTDFLAGTEAMRDVVQAGHQPANLRLLDAGEAARTAGGDGVHSLLVVGFESADEPVDDAMRAVRRRIERHAVGAVDGSHSGQSSADAWRSAFMSMPYLRDVLIRLGIVAETFETAVTWDRWPALHAGVIGAVTAAVGEPCQVSCRITHVYADGLAPYFTVLAPARRGAELEQWDAIKAAAMAVILDAGGTITHHHAVGRDHRPGYDRQRPDPFAVAMRAARSALDPDGRLNPGVLL